MHHVATAPGGQPAAPRLLQELAETLQRLQNRRFPTARLVQSRAEVDPDTHTAHLVVDYDSGPLYRYGPLRIQGAQRCRDRSCCLLLRLLALGP